MDSIESILLAIIKISQIWGQLSTTTIIPTVVWEEPSLQHDDHIPSPGPPTAAAAARTTTAAGAAADSAARVCHLVRDYGRGRRAAQRPPQETQTPNVLQFRGGGGSCECYG